ncbi:MAG: hypothetical protein AAGC46_06450 [Solirubrobacteraceae bacterium]|nr:hypothetical protein [Patulibacter sp.]
MTRLRHLPSALSVAFALALAVSGALTPDAHARAVKAAAPTLSIESKVCNIGATADDRFATITASALLGSTGDRVSMRFTVQSKSSTIAKARWRTVPAAPDSGLGTWQTGDAGHSGLRYTKTLNGLDEGVQYRVYVDARGVDEDGDVVTKQARKTVSCVEPLFTPTLSLTKATDALATGSHTVTATIKNLGRLTSAPPVVTVEDGTTRAVLGQVVAASGLKGNGTVKVEVPLSACNGSLFVTVQEQGADLADLLPTQSATVSCATASAARLKAR